MGSGEMGINLLVPHSPFLASGNNLYRGFHRDHFEQLFYLLIFKRDASQRPILNQSEQFSGSAAVNEDVSAEPRVLRRLRLGADGSDYRLMLGLRNQPLFQPLVGVGDVGIAEAQREIEFAGRVFMRDVIIAFWRRAVALSILRTGRIIAERDLIGLRQPLLPVFHDVKVKFALALFDEYAVARFRVAALSRLIALLSRG